MPSDQISLNNRAQIACEPKAYQRKGRDTAPIRANWMSILLEIMFKLIDSNHILHEEDIFPIEYAITLNEKGQFRLIQ
jgi:hypothetical protein